MKLIVLLFGLNILTSCKSEKQGADPQSCYSEKDIQRAYFINKEKNDCVEIMASQCFSGADAKTPGPASEREINAKSQDLIKQGYQKVASDDSDSFLFCEQRAKN